MNSPPKIDDERFDWLFDGMYQQLFDAAMKGESEATVNSREFDEFLEAVRQLRIERGRYRAALGKLRTMYQEGQSDFPSDVYTIIWKALEGDDGAAS